jgi:hypothetical protein
VIDNVILFCGGTPLYQNNRPKPLALMPNSKTILENYLGQKPLLSVPTITIIAEEDFVGLFAQIIDHHDEWKNKIVLKSSPNHSSTMEKLADFASSAEKQGSKFMFTYPDVFYFGNWDALFSEENFDQKMVVSSVYLQSRFSEVTFDPYTQRVRSVTLRPVRVPANASAIYGGHFLTQDRLLEDNLNIFEERFVKPSSPSLEGDFFKFLASEGSLRVSLLTNKWLKTDSQREMIEVLNLLQSNPYV